jgi:3-oxoacyl-[acyl-carrier-protein] synthase-3
MQAQISAIEYYLPERVVTNEDLAASFPEWTPAKILAKTGIAERRLAAPEQCSSDLAVEAAQKLFQSGACQRSDVDYILLCTQSPDYFLPTTACLLQDRLEIPQTAGALDFNLGCSGFVYGLGLAKGLIETGQARNILFITAETYSKFMHASDQSTRPIFGDAAAATLVTAQYPSKRGLNGGDEGIGPFVFGTDGSGADNLIVRHGGIRCSALDRENIGAEQPLSPFAGALHMNGPEIFNFTLRVVPDAVSRLLALGRKEIGDIDLFVFHQANQFMLDHLRRKLAIPQERFYIALRHCGNTVSSTIPIALQCAAAEGRLQPGHLVMLVGFGVGYSWGAPLIRWTGNARGPAV